VRSGRSRKPVHDEQKVEDLEVVLLVHQAVSLEAAVSVRFLASAALVGQEHLERSMRTMWTQKTILSSVWKGSVKDRLVKCNRLQSILQVLGGLADLREKTVSAGTGVWMEKHQVLCC